MRSVIFMCGISGVVDRGRPLRIALRLQGVAALERCHFPRRPRADDVARRHSDCTPLFTQTHHFVPTIHMVHPRVFQRVVRRIVSALPARSLCRMGEMRSP